jgi:hypothetical protein
LVWKQEDFMSDSERKVEVKRRALFGKIAATAFVAPVVASFALDALSVKAAHAASNASTAG